MSRAHRDLSAVIESSMCIGCGACEFVDEGVRVELNPTKLIFEPTSPGGERAASVCPAVAVDYAGLHEYLFPGSEVGPFGVIDSVMLAQSTDEQRNVRASSGGLIKELLRRLIGSGRVDGAIALTHVDGLTFEATLVDTVDGVDRLPGSIYHNLSQRAAIDLLRDRPGRYVVVAIPCQLEGLFSYVRAYAPELRERIVMTIGLLCGWQYSHHSIEAMGEYLGFDPKRIEHVSYRGGGPVGKFSVTLDDGSTFSASRRVDFSYQVAFDRHFNTPRCHLCVNHGNFLADLVVGDAWLPSTVFTKTGISLVVNRTPAATALVRELVDDGACVAIDATVEEIRESQTERVVFGEFAYAYADHLDELGLHHPELVGPNIDAGGRSPDREVRTFHRELVRKQALMQARRYRLLKWRKATLELPRLAKRYLRWFAVRILRVKSLTGQRREIPRERFRGFR